MVTLLGLKLRGRLVYNILFGCELSPGMGEIKKKTSFLFMVAFNACLTRDMMMQALFLRLHISFKAITFKVIFTIQ